MVILFANIKKRLPKLELLDSLFYFKQFLVTFEYHKQMFCVDRYLKKICQKMGKGLVPLTSDNN